MILEKPFSGFLLVSHFSTWLKAQVPFYFFCYTVESCRTVELTKPHLPQVLGSLQWPLLALTFSSLAPSSRYPASHYFFLARIPFPRVLRTHEHLCDVKKDERTTEKGPGSDSYRTFCSSWSASFAFPSGQPRKYWKISGYRKMSPVSGVFFMVLGFSFCACEPFSQSHSSFLPFCLSMRQQENCRVPSFRMSVQALQKPPE